jgi:hypothetical protein
MTDHNMTHHKKHVGLLVIAGLCWTLLVTVLRALRLPNDWAVSHWLINYYELGFIKRGLPGTLLASFRDASTPPADVLSWIYGVSLLLLLLFMATLLYLCIRLLKKHHGSILITLAILVFLTSPYVVMSAHLVGYFDNILVLLTILSCGLVMKDRVVVAAGLLSLGVMVHETLVLVGLPSVLWCACLRAASVANPVGITTFCMETLKKYYPLVLFPLATFIAIFANHLLWQDPLVLQQEIATYLSSFGFVSANLQQFIATSFTVSFADYYASMSGRFWLRFFWGDFIFKTGAPVLLLLLVCWQRLQCMPHRWFLAGLLVLITLLPLSLHLMAWDSSRIWTYPVIVALLALWVLGETTAPAAAGDSASRIFPVLAVALILYQLFSQIVLMDYATERFSAGLRALWYAPLLLWLAGLLYRQLSPAPR